MSYQIQYPVSNHLEKKYNSRARKKSRISVMVVLCMILLVVLVYIVDIDAVSEFIIPGNDAVTISSFNQMQNNLKNGMPVKEAVTAFCTEIIQSADIQ